MAGVPGSLAGGSSPQDPARIHPASAEPETIGTATMDDDGTITLYLRATSPGGAVGHGRIVYPPSSPHYAMIRGHIPGLRPGLTLPVRPFP